MTIHVRFAPSPTGFLHIGGARTALFNYLFARHHQGKYLLRVEDTDKARSTKAATAAIHDGLTWLGLAPDAPAVRQSDNGAQHRAVVQQLLDSGHAYYCYMTQNELAAERSAAHAKGELYHYDRRWRDADASSAPSDGEPSVRIKAPLTGSITIHDAVQGEVSVQCSELDDMVILRADGTPTYPLAVVADDHAMGITHIIRGDDHFTNSFRQAIIYQAMGWELPQMAHVPLIHGSDGAKLSKRHGALGVDAYRDMGYLPDALRNYLLKLGWSHGDDEIISDEQAIEWFDFEGLGKAPSRFDMEKLDHLNAHYIRECASDRCYQLLIPFVERAINTTLTDRERAMLRDALPELQARGVTLVQLADSALFYIRRPTEFTPKAQKLIASNSELFTLVSDALDGIAAWNAAAIEGCCGEYADAHMLKLGKVMNPLRAAITGSHASPSMFHVMEILGKEESLARIRMAVA